MINPIKSTQIFNYLRTGKFLSDNSRGAHKALFRYLIENRNEFIEIYKMFGMDLRIYEKYAYIAQIGDYKQRVKNIASFLTILGFFISYDRAFGPGTRIKVSEIEMKVIGSDNLKEMLIAKSVPIREQIENFIGKLEKHGFVELVDEIENEWLVLDAIVYLMDVFEAVKIEEEENVN